jgi:hypothetical protein
VLECNNQECPCKGETSLYDASTGKFSKVESGYHKDLIFLKHFIKRLYEEALDKFVRSALLHISFSHFLFTEMKNVHAALLSLDQVGKQKLSLKLQFMIYRQKTAIQSFIKKESTEQKDAYNKLINVIEFEILNEDCQKAIEKVVNLQIEFWAQVANQVPDLNILHDMVNKIFKAAGEVDNIWKMICEINSNHSKSMSLYGNYLLEIRNNGLIGRELLEK